VGLYPELDGASCCLFPIPDLVHPTNLSTMEVSMKRDYTQDGMPEYPESERMECPDPRLELRLQTYTEVPTRRDDSHVLAALAFDYEIGKRPERRGPSKPKTLPVIWLPGQDFDPTELELLLLNLGPVGNA
jgi:hypothetical protein